MLFRSPLLNKSGQVIGINTAKITTGEGLGFSIPINTAKGIIEEVINEGSYKTVQLGIQGMDIMEYQSRVGIDYGFEKGVIIIKVDEKSPADQANLRKHDIILKIDGLEIDTIESLKKALYNYREGDKAVLTVLREEKTEQIVYYCIKCLVQ